MVNSVKKVFNRVKGWFSPTMAKSVGAICVVLVLFQVITATARLDLVGHLTANGTLASAASETAEVVISPKYNSKIDALFGDASMVTVVCGDKTTTVITPDDTVGNIVAMAGIELSVHDLVSPSVDTLITADSVVDVVNIDYTVTNTQVAVPYGTKTVKSDKLLAGTKQITAGKDGVKVYTYNNKVVDGVVVNSELVGEEITVEPVDEIITIGTGGTNPDNPHGWISTLLPNEDILLDENGIPVNYVEKMVGTATAYHGDPATSTGVTPQPGYIAVNPKVIPYGTKMFIRSTDGKFLYGYAVAADTGGACMKNKIIADLYFPTEDSMHAFGRRQIEIYILK